MKFTWNNEATTPRLVLTAPGPEFDPRTIKHWQEEGYQVAYLTYNKNNRKEYIRHLQHLADPLDLGEKYAIVAYGEAASLVLEACIKPMPKLSTVIAYYPDKLPAPHVGYAPSLDVLVHMAGSQGMAPKTRSYNYPNAEPGFAEEDLDEYEKISAGLAWSRTLGTVRKGFGIEVDLEEVWEEHLGLEFFTKDADATMATMVAQPYVNHIPTLTGGIGYSDLHRFYRDFFIPGNPPSMKMRLLSRTIGVDRVVDEMHVRFRHTQVIPWILPGVEPTEKEVEIALATVLVQIGLLDSNLLTKGKPARRLPVVDSAGARKVLDESSVKSNELIKGWL